MLILGLMYELGPGYVTMIRRGGGGSLANCFDGEDILMLLRRQKIWIFKNLGSLNQVIYFGLFFTFLTSCFH